MSEQQIGEGRKLRFSIAYWFGIIIIFIAVIVFAYIMPRTHFFLECICSITGIMAIFGFFLSYFGASKNIEHGMEKRKVRIISILSTIMIVILFIIVAAVYGPGYTYKFTISIEAEGSGNYSLILPIPQDGNTPSNLNMMMIDKYDGFHLIETPNGTGIRINGSESVTYSIEGWVKEIDSIYFDTFSLCADKKYGETNYSVYGNFSGQLAQIEIIISCSIHSEGGGHFVGYDFNMKGTVNSGWNTISGKIYKILQ